MCDLVDLDGSLGEGGGQILRTALAASMLLGRGFKLRRIRAGRDKPGLRPQHLTCVKASAELCEAEVKGDYVGSSEIVFRPGAVRPRDMTIDIGTAGSTALVLHTLFLPIALRADRPVSLKLVGGTFNDAAPSYPFIETTWLRYMNKFGLKATVSSPRVGFYPRGGGELNVVIEPGALVPLTLVDRPPIVRVRGFAGIAGLVDSIAERMSRRALKRLEQRGLSVPVEIETVAWRSNSKGAAIALEVELESAPSATFVGLGAPGKPAESIVDHTVDELLEYVDAPIGVVDPHSADQILAPAAFAEGTSEYASTRVTEHLRTNADTMRAFVDRTITIEENDDGSGRVVVS
jgi:RNA 3'-terminal phosphate cyclase (ATP)